MAETDVIVRKQGLSFFFYLISIAASEWVEEKMPHYSCRHHRLSNTCLVVELEWLFDVAAAMSTDGLRIRFERSEE